jgi:hypothetical protein
MSLLCEHLPFQTHDFIQNFHASQNIPPKLDPVIQNNHPPAAWADIPPFTGYRYTGVKMPKKWSGNKTAK